jgi:SAM-dependent methyltransferase
MAIQEVAPPRVEQLGPKAWLLTGSYFDEHMTILDTSAGLVVVDTLSTAATTERVFPRQDRGVLEPENDDEARLNRLLPPDKIMDAAGVAQGMIVAEIGAGHGRFVVHLAVRLGETGIIYAEDIDAAALRHTERRCEKWGLNNVETIQGDIADPKLPVGKLDLIFVVSSYHHFEDSVPLLQKARSALKVDGRLVIAEWLPWNENDREGTTPEDMTAQIKSAGYELMRTEKLDVAKPLNIYIFRSSPMINSEPLFLRTLFFR